MVEKVDQRRERGVSIAGLNAMTQAGVVGLFRESGVPSPVTVGLEGIKPGRDVVRTWKRHGLIDQYQWAVEFRKGIERARAENPTAPGTSIALAAQ